MKTPTPSNKPVASKKQPKLRTSKTSRAEVIRQGFLPDGLKTMPIKRGKARASKVVFPEPVPVLAKSMAELTEMLVAGKGCLKCKLGKTRTQIVVGDGDPKAEVVFVGEAPGEQEDLQGKPFIGRAGQLLTKMIEAMGLSRAEVYICNVVKCRPPENRNPEPDEVYACSPYLLGQLGVIRPKVIVALGTFAAQTLLRTEEKISNLRGGKYEYAGIRLIPTFHPSYLLRSPSSKKDAWEDLKQVCALLGREVPKKVPAVIVPAHMQHHL